MPWSGPAGPQQPWRPRAGLVGALPPLWPPSTRSSPPAGQAPGRSSLGDLSAGGGSSFRVGSRRPSPGCLHPGLPHLDLRGRASSWPPAWSCSPRRQARPCPRRCQLPASPCSPPCLSQGQVCPNVPFLSTHSSVQPFVQHPLSARQVPGMALPRERAGSGTSKRYASPPLQV